MADQIVPTVVQLAIALLAGYCSVRYARHLLHDDSLREKVDKNTSDIKYLKGIITGLFRDGSDS